MLLTGQVIVMSYHPKPTIPTLYDLHWFLGSTHPVKTVVQCLLQLLKSFVKYEK